MSVSTVTDSAAQPTCLIWAWVPARLSRKGNGESKFHCQNQNYRSVSLLSLFGKVMERIVYDELLWHAAPVLSPAQHGFLPGRSCTTNLTTYLHTAWRSMSDRCQTDAIYTDFSSAFQSVNHRLLLHKLSQSYNVSGKIFD